ncbi:MAG: hypothetical protein K2X49_14610 [Acetobacteraceae bacterium]|nr:hypothetical protein [Acetobacteraceae bacterium]
MPTWFTTLTPYVLALVTWSLGFWAWRYQLRAKRRTELAEEALLAFANAVDAMASIRAPMSFAGEHAALRKELGEPEDKKLPGEDYRIILWRLGRRNERFAELRRVQLLCKYHFGEAAHDAFERLHHARHRVWVAAHMGATVRDDNWEPTPENMKLRREWQDAIWAGAAHPDPIADAVSAAQRDLEAILTPHLRADASLLPIAVGWRAGKARAAALIRRGDSSKPAE